MARRYENKILPSKQNDKLYVYANIPFFKYMDNEHWHKYSCFIPDRHKSSYNHVVLVLPVVVSGRYVLTTDTKTDKRWTNWLDRCYIPHIIRFIVSVEYKKISLFSAWFLEVAFCRSSQFLNHREEGKGTLVTILMIQHVEIGTRIKGKKVSRRILERVFVGSIVNIRNEYLQQWARNKQIVREPLRCSRDLFIAYSDSFPMNPEKRYPFLKWFPFMYWMAYEKQFCAQLIAMFL